MQTSSLVWACPNSIHAGKTGTRERGISALKGRENPPWGDGELSYEEGRRRLGKRRKGVRDVISKRSNPEEENKARESVVTNKIEFI